MSEQVFGCLGLFEECLRACFGKFGAIPDPFNIKKQHESIARPTKVPKTTLPTCLNHLEPFRSRAHFRPNWPCLP